MCVCVFDPCSQLHNSYVGALYVCLCTVICAPYLQEDFFWFAIFTKWFNLHVSPVDFASDVAEFFVVLSP